MTGHDRSRSLPRSGRCCIGQPAAPKHSQPAPMKQHYHRHHDLRGLSSQTAATASVIKLRLAHSTYVYIYEAHDGAGPRAGPEDPRMRRRPRPPRDGEGFPTKTQHFGSQIASATGSSEQRSSCPALPLTTFQHGESSGSTDRKFRVPEYGPLRLVPVARWQGTPDCPTLVDSAISWPHLWECNDLTHTPWPRHRKVATGSF